MIVFVDTNVLVDFVCNRQSFAEDAKRLFAHAFIGEFEIRISALSYVNAVYIGHKYEHYDVKGCLRQLSAYIKVVDLQGKVVVDMLSSEWKDYEDAVQNQSALLEGVDCIVTRNKKDFKNSSLPIYTIEEFFNTIEKDEEKLPS